VIIEPPNVVRHFGIIPRYPLVPANSDAVCAGFYKRSYKLRQTRHGTRRRSEFSRLAQLIRSLQLSEALQVRIELAKESNETSLVHGLTISGRRDGKLL